MATSPEMMKAWICRRYGGPEVLSMEERPKPAPGADELLIRIHATTVSSGDMRLRSLNLPRGLGLVGRILFGLTRPRQPVLGTELAGTVVCVGGEDSSYKLGDEVIAFPGASMGCHAGFRVVAANGPIAPKPENLSFEEAAGLCFGGTTAMHFLRKAGAKAGDKVLVIGASGAVGSAMVQLARHIGARVTGVTSTRNVELVQSLGAAEVIDYKKSDFTTIGESFDIIADTVGASSFGGCRALLNEGGRYLAIAGELKDMIPWRSGTKRSIGGPAAERPDDVRELARLAAAGVFKPVIDKVYAFSQMPDAHAHVDTGRKRGSVVVSMGHTAPSQTRVTGSS